MSEKRIELKWIPVDEELPYQNEVVLVSTKQGYVQIGYLSSRNIWHSSSGGLWTTSNVVIAWSRLPEAYKEK